MYKQKYIINLSTYLPINNITLQLFLLDISKLSILESTNSNI